MIRQMK